MLNQHELSISPQPALVDEEIRIRVTGFDAGTRVRLTARSQWTEPKTASAILEADDHGAVDTTEHAPVAGDYENVEPMGLFTRLDSVDELPDETADFPSITLTVSVNNDTVATTDIDRRMAADGVETVEIESNGLIGRFYKPASKGPHPGIIVIDGSQGGHVDSVRPSLLASRGFLVLGVAYFNADGVSDTFHEIPVEYFEQAADWLLARADCSGSLGVIGTSRGCEMACHLATACPQIDAVINYAGGPIRYESPAVHGDPAWISDTGVPPFVRTVEETVPSTRDEYNNAREAIERVVTDTSDVDDAIIPLEHAEAEFVFFSGADDDTWASWALSELAIEHLDNCNYEQRYEHHCYTNTGHLLWAPYLPTTTRHARQTPDGETITFGGTTKGHAESDQHSWQHLLQTLTRTLQ